MEIARSVAFFPPLLTGLTKRCRFYVLINEFASNAETMRKTFKGFYRPTEEEFQTLWKTCLFVLDANVLLNVYRYSKKTNDDLINLLNQISERLWVPYQAAFEYQRGRLKLILDQKEAYEKIKKGLDTSLTQLEKDLQIYAKHPLINLDPLIKEVKSAFKNVKEELDKTKTQHPDLIQDDPLRDTITQLFDGKVGPPYPPKKLQEIYQAGEKRYGEKIPPGYSDAKKAGVEKYGDLILWLQIIDKAREAKTPIIFVTDDRKEDWWYRPEGQTMGPQPQLVEEIDSEAGVLFYMYNADRFMEEIKQYLTKKVDPKTIEEVRSIRKKDEEAFRNYASLRSKLSELASRSNTWSEAGNLLEKMKKMRDSEISPLVKEAIELFEIGQQAIVISNALVDVERSDGRIIRLNLYGQRVEILSVEGNICRCRPKDFPYECTFTINRSFLNICDPASTASTRITPRFNFETVCPECGEEMIAGETGDCHCEKCGYHE